MNFQKLSRLANPLRSITAVVYSLSVVVVVCFKNNYDNDILIHLTDIKENLKKLLERFGLSKCLNERKEERKKGFWNFAPFDFAKIQVGVASC